MMIYRNNLAIVTGAAGFTGAVLTSSLLNKNYDVCCITRPNSSHNDRLPRISSIECIECELHNYKQLPDLIQARLPDLPNYDKKVFFHLAVTGNKDLTSQAKNIDHVLAAVEVATKLKCNRIIITGSQAEYGVIPPTTKQTEDMPCNPITAYGAAKLAACHLSRIRAQELNIEWIWARIFSLIGKYEPHGRMLPDLFSALKGGHDFHLSSGRQNWDYLDVHDAAEALIALAEKGHSNEIYNIANGNYKPLKEYTEELKTLIGGTGQIYYGEDSNPFISLQPSVAKIHTHTGWRPKRSFEESVRDY